LHFVFDKDKGQIIITKEMPQEHLLQVSPEIAANEMLLKEHLGKKISQRRFNMFPF
jgi:hypothetical protein